MRGLAIEAIFMNNTDGVHRSLAEPVLIDAHRKATAAMKAGPGRFPVGLTLTMQDVQGVGEGNRAEALIDQLYGPWLDVARDADFIGVQTYSRVLVGPEGRRPPPEGAEMTGAPCEFYPEAIGGTIRFVHERIGRPIYVTENGIATDDDTRRIVSAAGVAEQITNRLPDDLLETRFVAGHHRFRPRFGYGYNGVVLTDPDLAGLPVGCGTYHWDGAAGTWFWIDPENDLLCVGMIQLLSFAAPPLQAMTQRLMANALKD